jgi:hypothetical protein
MSVIVEGDRYSKLVAVSPVHGSRPRKWIFRCDCGQEKHIRQSAVRVGQTVSCGCVAVQRLREHRRYIHGGYATPEYAIWSAMICRCENPNSASFRRYGGRGIAVCQSWRASFAAFLNDVGARPSAEYSLDRIDNDRGYEPGNVRWASKQSQARNRRSSRIVEYLGRRMSLAEACALAGLDYKATHARLQAGAQFSGIAGQVAA